MATPKTSDAGRCPWPGEDPLYVAYHDEEWGVPEYDDRALFEKLILDGFQAGLSWITILRKRESFGEAFDTDLTHIFRSVSSMLWNIVEEEKLRKFTTNIYYTADA